MEDKILPRGHYKAILLGTSGSPEIIVYSNGENYFSFDSATPQEPLDPGYFMLEETPILPSLPEDKLKQALFKARDFIIKTANEYKTTKSLTIDNSLEGGSLVSELDSILKTDN